MTGDCCVFKFLRRSVDGALQIPKAFCDSQCKVQSVVKKPWESELILSNSFILLFSDWQESLNFSSVSEILFAQEKSMLYLCKWNLQWSVLQTQKSINKGNYRTQIRHLTNKNPHLLSWYPTISQTWSDMDRFMSNSGTVNALSHLFGTLLWYIIRFIT